MTEADARAVEIALGCVHWAPLTEQGHPRQTACGQEIALHGEAMVGATAAIQLVNCPDCSEVYTRLWREGRVCTHHGLPKLRSSCRRCRRLRRQGQ